MDARLRALLLLLVFAATAAVDSDEDMSGSGSGGEFPSGDGEDSCRPPSFTSEPLPSQEELPLLTEIRCHVACLQRVSFSAAATISTAHIHTQHCVGIAIISSSLIQKLRG